MQDEWLVKILVGAVIGYLLPHFIRLLAWPLIYFRSHLLKKGWWEYHYSVMDGEIEIFESKVNVRVGLRGSLVFKLHQLGSDLKYSGSLKIEKGSSQFVMVGKSSDPENEENMIWRFYLPLQSRAHLITGINTSYNHDKDPYSSVSFLSRERFELSNAKQVLNSIEKTSGNFPMILVSKGSQLTSQASGTPQSGAPS